MPVRRQGKPKVAARLPPQLLPQQLPPQQTRLRPPLQPRLELQVDGVHVKSLGRQQVVPPQLLQPMRNLKLETMASPLFPRRLFGGLVVEERRKDKVSR